MRRRPYSVVLFDEIEKAHSDIQNLLLQILEDGNLTDSQGRRADFSNTIILLTSNLGARCLSGQTSPLGFGAAAAETRRRGQQAIQEAKEFFRPELMGRLDETVLFDPLGPEQLAGIADRLLVELEQRAARQGYTLQPRCWPGTRCRPTVRGSCAAPSAVPWSRPLRTASLPVQLTPAPFTPPMWTPTGTLS